jgi:hypothetical protein
LTKLSSLYWIEKWEKENEFHQGSISPNFFAKQKVARERRGAKNLKFNFINKVVRLKLSQNLPNYVYHSQKKVKVSSAATSSQRNCRRSIFALIKKTAA